MSIARKCFIALTRHALSCLPAMISLIPCLNGSVFDAGNVSSMWFSSAIS